MKRFIKNNKGFTLVELIAVIAIIALISVIAALAYGKIQKSMKEKQLEGTHNRIKAVAFDFYEDTRLEEFNVQMLIDYGLLSTDNNTYQIINPVNNKSMNCYDIKFTENIYSITESYTCKNYTYMYEDLLIVNEDGSIFDDTKWYNKNLKLRPKLSDDLINNGAQIVSVKWTKKGDTSFMSTSEVLELNVNDNSVLNDTYSVSVTLNNQNFKVGAAYANVKIDKIKPIIEETERLINCGNGSSISVNIRDNDSKIKQYSIKKQGSSTNIDDEVLDTPKDQTNVTFPLDTAANYIIEAYDNANNLGNYNTYIDASPKLQSTKITVYDQNNKELSHGAKVTDTYKFKISVDWKSDACEGKIYYCVDTNNTCVYNKEAKNNTLISAPNTSNGTYFIRYKSENRDGNINTGSFKVTIERVEIDTGDLSLSKYAIEDEITDLNNKISIIEGFSGSNGTYTISNFNLSNYYWYIGGYSASSLLVGTTTKTTELYGENASSTLKIGFNFYKYSNVKKIRFGLYDNNKNYKTLELNLDNLDLEDFHDYFISFKAKVVSKTLTINDVKLYKIISLDTKQWTNKDTIITISNESYSNFKPQYYTVADTNSVHNISGNYLICSNETSKNGNIHKITNVGLNESTNLTENSEEKNITVYIDKSKPIINDKYVFNIDHINTSWVSVNCFQNPNDATSYIQPNGYGYKSYKYIDYNSTPFNFDYSNNERTIDKARGTYECIKDSRNITSYADKIKYVSYPSKVDITDDEVVIHICNFKNHKYYYSRDYYYTYIQYIYEKAHKDELSGLDTTTSSKFTLTGYYDYAGNDMNKTGKSCGINTVPCITTFKYNVYDKAGNEAEGYTVKLIIHDYDYPDRTNSFSSKYKYDCSNTISKMDSNTVYLLCERQYYSNNKWSYQTINGKNYGINKECFSNIANKEPLF